MVILGNCIKTIQQLVGTAVFTLVVWLSIFNIQTASAQVKELSVAYCIDCVPFHFQDSEGKPAGLIIDYWHAWSEKTGIKVKFVAATWDETLKMVGSGAANAHAGLFFNEARDKFLDYGVTLRKTDTHVFFHRGLPTTTNYRELSAYRIGVLKGDFVEGYLKQRVPSGSIVGYPDYKSIIEALKTGELKVFAADTPTGLFFLKKAGLLADFSFVSDGPLYRNDWFVAAKEGDSATIKLINDGMALVTDTQKTEIARKWIGSTQKATKDDALIIAIDRSYPPFTFMNAQGLPAGLFVDLWKIWSERSGQKIRFRPSNWKETLEGLRTGEVDFHSGLSYSDTRAKEIDFSNQVYQTASRIYHRNGEVVPADLGAFGNRTLAVFDGSFQEAEIRRMFPNTNLKAYPTSKAMVSALLDSEVDALIQEDLVIEVMLRELGLQGRIVARPERMLISTIHAGVAKGKVDLLKNIDASLNLIAEGDKENIEARWIANQNNRFFGKGMSDEKIQLTHHDRRWLNSHPLIRLGSDRAWPPYEFLNSDGVLGGLSGTFINRIQEILGVTFLPPESLSWKETMARAKAGKIDVLSAVADTPERRKYFNFTQPYMVWPNVIATRTDAHGISGLADLVKKRVGVVDGYAIQSTLKRKNPDVILVPHTDIAEALKALSAGKIEAFVGAPVTIEHVRKQQQLTNIAVVAQTPHKLEISIAVRKDWPELVTILNKALEQIPPGERRELAQSAGLSTEIDFAKLDSKSGQWLTSNEVETLVIVVAPLLVFVLVFVWLLKTQRRPFFQSLRGKSILFIVGVFILVGGSTLWVLSLVGDQIAVKLGNFVAERHVLWHKEKVLGAIQRELALSKQMANSELLQRWAVQEDNPILAADARKELQRYHDNFKARTFFVGLKKSGHFFYSDEKVKEVSLKVINTLLPAKKDDAWFFATIKDKAPYNLNVDHNAQLGVTKLWVNYAMRRSGETLGVVGTGIHLTEFIKDFIQSNTQGVKAIMIDGAGSYRAHTDESKIAQNKVAAKAENGGSGRDIWQSISDEGERRLLKQQMDNLKSGVSTAETIFLHLEGVRSLVAISYLKPLEWYSLAIFEPDTIVGFEEFGTLAGVLGIALLLSVFVFIVGQNMLIIHPLRGLIQGTSKVSEGDYNVKLAISQNDELGDLTQTFNNMASTISDYTGNLEQKVNERTAELKESQDLIKAVIDNIPAIIFLKKPDGTFQLVNHRYEEIYDLELDKIKGKSLHDIYPKEQADMFSAYDREMLDSGVPRENEHTIEIDGSELIFNNMMFQVLDENGEMKFYGGIEIDITERKMAEQAIRASENKIRRILETADEGFWLIDNDAITVDVNPKICSMLKYERDELIGRSIFEFVDEDNLRIYKTQIQKRKEGEVGAYEIAYTRSDGRQVPCLLNATPLFDDEGVRTGSFAMVTDITDRKKAESELAEKEAYLSVALGNMSDGMFLMGKDENYILINDRYKELTQLPPELLSVGKSVRKVVEHLVGLQGFPALKSEKAVDDRMNQLAGSDSVRMEMHVPNGPILELRNAPAGEVGAVIVATDMTQRKEAEEALKEARDAAEEATKAKANFLAAMSHEIRTPMNGVVGMIDLLRESKLDDDQLQMVETVKSSAYSLLTIINDILDFSKIEAGKLDLEEIPISIADAVEGVSEALAVTARNKNLRLCVYVDPDIPDGVIGDQVRLRQIIFNLGGNAIKFTEQGKVLIRADRMPSDDDKQVAIRLQVIDDGIGIPEAAQKSLFQAFSQVDASTTRRFGGTGLGLSISQRLTELMGGEIGVNSIEGKGSTFHVTVTLPIAEDHNFRPDGEDLGGLRVLVAMGDPELRDLTPRYLEHWGADTEVIDQLADIKSAALAAVAASEPFDAIVIGSSWALEDQIALIKELRAEETLSAKYVVACRERSRKERKELGDTVYVDADPMQRGAFVRGVAVAVGRASPDIEYDDSEIAKDPGKAPSVEEAAANGQLILLAEDNLTNQNVIKRQLDVLGYAVEIANDGLEALELMKKREYAILLTDCHMPNLDGFDLTKNIRKSEADLTDRLPIVAVTASVMKEEIDNCFASGMNDYLMKPLEMDKLRAMLRKWMPESESKATATISSESDDTEVDPTDSNATSSGGNGPIDPTALKSIFGDDDDTFVEILKEFVEPSSANAEEIEIAYQERSADGVSKAAHKLKSSSRSIGANELADICQTLEAAGKKEDWEVIDNVAPRLSTSIQEVIEYINAL